MVSDRGMKPLKGDQQLRSVSLSYSVALQALKPKSSPRRIRAGMQAPIEVSRREGEVFLLDILSHRMSAIASRQLIFTAITAGASRVASGLLYVHAVAITPAGSMEHVRSSLSIVSGLPREKVGSAPAIVFSRPAQRSLTLRPARSPSR